MLTRTISGCLGMYCRDTETESKHPVFGRVKDEAGLEVIKALSKVETDVDDRPVKPAKIKAVAIR